MAWRWAAGWSMLTSSSRLPFGGGQLPEVGMPNGMGQNNVIFCWSGKELGNKILSCGPPVQSMRTVFDDHSVAMFVGHVQGSSGLLHMSCESQKTNNAMRASCTRWTTAEPSQVFQLLFFSSNNKGHRRIGVVMCSVSSIPR